MAQPKVAVWSFVAAGVLSLIAAVIPMLGGGRLNVTFLALAVVWFVLSGVVARKSRTDATPPAP